MARARADRGRRPTAARMATVWALLLAGALAACGRSEAGTPAATALSPVEHGRKLFRDKGCVTCHYNARVPGETGLYAIGPNLSDYANSPEFLRQWLANPGAVRPGTAMPDLDLGPAEIEDLIAFLNEAR